MDPARDDYAHTGHARKNRMAKDAAVARLLYHDGVNYPTVHDRVGAVDCIYWSELAYGSALPLNLN